jgi:hypothetical protein
MYLDSLMLRLLHEADEYMDYNPTRSRDILRRVMRYLEDRVNGTTEETRTNDWCEW